MQPVKRGDVPRLIGRTKGGLNSKLHAVCDGEGRPVRLLLTEGQQSDHKGAATLLADLPSATEMLGDKGYDSDAYRAALVKRGIAPCIPPRAKRKNPATYCKALYKQRHKVENMFAKLKDWRRIAMRYDRCAHVFLSAIQIAAVIIFWINQCVLTLVFPVLGGRFHWGATLWCHVTRAKGVCLICEFSTDACVMGPQVRDCLHSTTIGAHG